jgi:hypothetical protein
VPVTGARWVAGTCWQASSFLVCVDRLSVDVDALTWTLSLTLVARLYR